MNLRTLLLAILALVSGQAAGEWERLGTSGEPAVYFDPGSISRGDGKVKMLTLLDHKTPISNLRGWIYRSVKTVNEFDCTRERRRAVFSALHFGQMGGGIVVGNERSGWVRVEPGDRDEALWKLACREK